MLAVCIPDTAVAPGRRLKRWFFPPPRQSRRAARRERHGGLDERYACARRPPRISMRGPFSFLPPRQFHARARRLQVQFLRSLGTLSPRIAFRRTSTVTYAGDGRMRNRAMILDARRYPFADDHPLPFCSSRCRSARSVAGDGRASPLRTDLVEQRAVVDERRPVLQFSRYLFIASRG